MRRVSVGAHRLRASVETPARSDDGAGGAATSWTAVGAAWIALEDPRAGEPPATREAGPVRLTARLRPGHGVREGDRLALGTRRLLVRAVLDPTGRGRGELALCEEEAP